MSELMKIEHQKILGRYQIGGELGKGGRGVVYLAEDLVLGREVAVKIMLSDGIDPEARERFRNEARIAAKLMHPAITPIYDFGEHDDELFIVMPVIHGQTLRARSGERRLTPGQVVEIAIHVAGALEHSHSEGVIHRDIKPENIMVDGSRDGTPQVKILDFGLAVDLEQRRPGQSGSLYGTVLYVSPEQLLGETVGPQTDIYALGMVLYECLAGHHPLREGEGKIFQRLLFQDPPALGEIGVELPRELERLISDCLAKESASRPPDARAVLEVLRRAREALEPAMSSVPISSGSLTAGETTLSYADRLGDILLVQGEYLEAAEAYRSARDKQRSIQGHLPPRTEARYLLKLAHLALKLGRYDEALERCRLGLWLVETAHPRLAVEMAALAGLVDCMRGRFGEARRWIRRGRAGLERAKSGGVDTRTVEVALLRSQGNLLMGLGRAPEAVEIYEQALALTEALDDRWERSIALFNVGEACFAVGDEETAIDYLSQAVDEKSAIGDRWGLAYTHYELARIYLQRGSMGRALREAESGLRLASEVGDPKIISRLTLVLGRIFVARNDLERATAHFRAALQEAERSAMAPETTQAYRGFESVSTRMRVDDATGEES